MCLSVFLSLPLSLSLSMCLSACLSLLSSVTMSYLATAFPGNIFLISENCSSQTDEIPVNNSDNRPLLLMGCTEVGLIPLLPSVMDNRFVGVFIISLEFFFMFFMNSNSFSFSFCNLDLFINSLLRFISFIC